MGKGFYLIFTALLTLGFIRDDKVDTPIVPELDWIAGIAWLGSGLLHLFVACQMPEVVAAYVPPKTGFENSSTDDDAYTNPV